MDTDKPITYLSLCSGGGGLDLGVERAITGLGRRVRCIAHVEREAYACAVLATRMEEGSLASGPIWSDVVTFDARPLLGEVDIVVAGVPCQGNSVAGKRLGRADERWLWPSVARILDECRPEWFFFENVRGLLSVDSGAAFGEILGTLAGLGYDAEWVCLRASDVGAPHRRDRIFLLAHAVGRERNAGSGDESRRGIVGSGVDGRDVVHAEGFRWGEGWSESAIWIGQNASNHSTSGGVVHASWPPGPDDDLGWRHYLFARPDLAPATKSPVRRGAHGVADRLGATRIDELRLLGNGVVPKQAERALLELLGRFGDA